MLKIKEHSKRYDQLYKLALITIVGLIFLNVYQYVSHNKYVENNENTIFVKTEDGIINAERKRDEITLEDVSLFVSNWYHVTFSHNRDNYQNNMLTMKKFMKDNEAKSIINAFEELNYLEDYVEEGCYTSIEIDSLLYYTKLSPYKVKIVAKQFKTYPDGYKSSIPINSVMEISELKTQKTMDNPYRLFINNFVLVK